MLSSRVPGRSYFLLLTGLRTGQGSWAKLLSQPWRWRGRAGRAGEAGPGDARPGPRSARAIPDPCLCVCRQVRSCCDESLVCTQTDLWVLTQERVPTLLLVLLCFSANVTYNLRLATCRLLRKIADGGAVAAFALTSMVGLHPPCSVLCALCACASLGRFR